MIRVTCALIERAHLLLITQRSASMAQPLCWEFPGGKIEAGETEQNCLIREVREELKLNIICRSRLTPSIFKYPNLTIELIPYICSAIAGELKLQEHVAYKWVPINELRQYDWCPADIPIVEEYIQLKQPLR